MTAQCAESIITSSSTNEKDTVLPRRTTWTAKILPATDDRLQQEAMRVLTPLYKEIGACFMGDGCQSTSNRPILNILAASDGFINVRRGKTKTCPSLQIPWWQRCAHWAKKTSFPAQWMALAKALSLLYKRSCRGCSALCASACEHMWSIEGWIHNKRRNRLVQPNVEKAVRAHGNLVLRKAMLLSRQQKVAWDSQTRISEPDRRTNEQGADDADEDDIDSDASTARQDQH